MTAILLHNLRLKTRKQIRNNNIHVIGERKKFKSLDSSKNIMPNQRQIRSTFNILNNHSFICANTNDDINTKGTITKKYIPNWD